MLFIARKHEECLARGYENNSNVACVNYATEIKHIKEKKQKLHAGPDKILLVILGLSDVCNFAGILISRMLLFSCLGLTFAWRSMKAWSGAQFTLRIDENYRF